MNDVINGTQDYGASDSGSNRSSSMKSDERSMVSKGPSLHELRLLCQQCGAEESRKNAIEVPPHPSTSVGGTWRFSDACFGMMGA